MPPPGGSGDSDLLQRLLTGQGSTEQRFEELFRRLDKAEKTAGEARDIAREIATILREQDIQAKIAEARAEAQTLVAALRQDLVLSNGNLRERIDAHEARVETLEVAKAAAGGMARGLRLAIEVAKVVAGAGGGALLIKLSEHL